MIGYIINSIITLLIILVHVWLLKAYLPARPMTVFKAILLPFLASIIFLAHLSSHPILRIMICIIPFVAIAYLYFYGRPTQRILAGTLSFIVALASEFFNTAIYGFMLRVSDLPQLTGPSIGPFKCLLNLSVYFLLASTLRLFPRLYKKRTVVMEISPNLWLVSLPLLSIAIMYYMDFVITKLGMNTLLFVFSAIILLLLNIVNAVVIIEEENVNRMKVQEKIHKQLFEQQAACLEHQMGLSHDFKNQLIGIKNMLLPGNAADDEMVLASIEQSLNDISKEQFFHMVPNPVVRSFLYATKSTCSLYGIDFRVSVDYCQLDGIQYPALATILGNLLENATEACLRITDGTPRYIDTQLYRVGNKQVIRVANSYNGERLPDGTGLFTSVKADSINHGIGLKNVRRVCKEYYGTVTFEDSSNEFTVIISLPFE